MMHRVDVPENMMLAAPSLHIELTTLHIRLFKANTLWEHVFEVPNIQVIGGCSGTHMLFSLAISEYSGIMPGSCGTDVDIIASSL